MAIGLGSVDVPVPSVAEWEWLNWKFPRSVHAGDTIYAHWMLTQKRPPVSGAPSSIVVWRVDVHTTDGALCAEGEIGAKVNRKVAAARRQVREHVAAAAAAPRRRRRRSRANGAAAVPEPQPVAAPPAAAAKPERASGTSRRRRRRRSPASAAREEAHPPETTPAPAAATPPPTGSTRPTNPRGLSGVLRRIRGT